MKTKDILTISTVALGTAALTIATFYAGPMEAGNEGNSPNAMIATPKLVAHGVEFSVAAAGNRTFQAGDQPEFELKAVNTTDRAAEVLLGVTMTAASPADRLSRAIRLPNVLWDEQQTMTLRPKETKTVTLTAKTNLPAGNLISVMLQERVAGERLEIPQLAFGTLQHPGVMAYTFSTVSTNSALASFVSLVSPNKTALAGSSTAGNTGP